MVCPFDLTNKNEVISFKEVDPYNPQNTLEGYVNRRQGQLYGSLWITKVNNTPCEQFVYSAPKQHYPFDKNNEWKFPECDYVDLYEKLDGTCVISYLYEDQTGNLFLTFKTRLRPFLGKGKFGNFFALWNEMLEKYPSIKEYCFNMYFNYVFELYGKRNKILIEYDTPLDTKLIFSVDTSDGKIYPPDYENADIFNVPILESKGMLTGWHDYNEEGKKEQYLRIQQELESSLSVDLVNEILKGKEGYVWYFLKNQDDDLLSYAVQVKCKPPTVLKYHWSGEAIPYESIYTTVVNAFENFDNVTIENVKTLLEEEFDISKIEKSMERIKKILTKVAFDKELQYQIVEKYNKLNIDINKDKGSVMRYFAREYDKKYAQRIITLLNMYVKKDKG